jgi:REP element-mobilizing transposase RayT
MMQMPRIARMKVKGEPSVYHVVSRTALDGLVFGNVEKEFLLNHIKHLSKVYFAEVLGFCIMGNHFHLLVRMHPGTDVNDREIQKRFEVYYGRERNQEVRDREKIGELRKKWEDLSEYVKEIKQGFSRFYNKRHNRKGFFWSERFKSVIVDNGDTLINCLAYIDLNPIRAGIVKKPEDYRWSSLGYHVQAGNRDGFLSTDFGLVEFGVKDMEARLTHYRRYVYGKGGIRRSGVESSRGVELSAVERFRFRTRYFTDSGIIGSRGFVERIYQEFKTCFFSKHEKQPKAIKGLEGVFSLKRLSETI